MTLKLSHPLPLRRVSFIGLSGDKLTAILHNGNRRERTRRYVERTALKGFRIYAVGQPWIGGIA